MFLSRRKKTVFLGMSGGVDSSVAALLLQKQGYSVVGVFMRNWHEDLHEGFGDCTWEKDQEDVRRVCAKLDIPFYTWDFSKEYYNDVVEYFFREYNAGRTPNPDVMCNKFIKFGRFYDRAMNMGADYVATGHYVQRRLRRNIEYRISNLEKKSNNKQSNWLTKKYQLVEGKDNNKDQSYFLWTITQDQVAHSLFPIGEYEKPIIRKIAEKAGLSTASKPDSQGICFIGNIDVREFIKTRLPEKEGDIVTVEGKTVGKHVGVQFYTEGQRQGLNIGGTGEPYYVVGKNMMQNELIVALGPDHDSLYAQSLTATDDHWIAGVEPTYPLKCSARIRYRQQPSQACTITKTGETLTVEFNEKQRAIAPGQSIVFYDKNTCLGGAIIDSRSS